MDGIVNPTLREKLDRSIVDKIIRTKMRFGVGLPVKQREKAVKWSDQLAEELHEPVMKTFPSRTKKNLVQLRDRIERWKKKCENIFLQIPWVLT